MASRALTILRNFVCGGFERAIRVTRRHSENRLIPPSPHPAARCSGE